MCMMPRSAFVCQVQDSTGDSAATQYHMRALSPGPSPGRHATLLTPAAPHSPLLAHPVTPRRAPRRPHAGRSPSHAGQPLMHAAQPHNHPDFATIYAFLGSLFDPVRSEMALVVVQCVQDILCRHCVHMRCPRVHRTACARCSGFRVIHMRLAVCVDRGLQVSLAFGCVPLKSHDAPRCKIYDLLVLLCSC